MSSTLPSDPYRTPAPPVSTATPPLKLPHSASDRALHGYAAIGLAVVCALAGSAVWASKTAWGGKGDTGPDLDDMEAIEASLAYKKADVKQPQKKKAPPPPETKVEGVSHDDKAKPVDKPKDDQPKAKPVSDPDPAQPATMPDDDDDTPVGKPTEDVGQFDGSEFGFAEETKGDPYFQKLIADLRSGWEYPKLLQGAGVPVGCVRLEGSGKVSDTLFKEKSGDGDLDQSVEVALKRLKKLRDESPRPVPDHLLKHTTRWICFKFVI